ncbi:MFS transporter [Pseudomonas sp. MPC6]|uniref:MFS transporter n=1 Tax=unclassified Pseudomonas TaxID=196821 RepID=UPI0013754EBB|nr:MFS transporter [Pseudomonas sp. MPC6]
MSGAAEVALGHIDAGDNPTEHFGPRAVWSAIILATFVLMVFLIQPLLIGGLAELGFTETQQGLLAAADLLGMAIASIAGVFWVRRFPWRPTMFAGVVVVICSNLICIGLSDFASLIGLRLLSGLGAGSVVVLTMSIISRTSRPDRNISFFIAFQICCQAIGFLLMASVVASHGVRSLYYLFAALAALGSVLIGFIPHGAASEAQDGLESPVVQPVGRIVLLLILAAIAVFFLAQSALWAFAERIGSAAGHSVEDVGAVLALSSAFAFAGALIPGWLDLRFGRAWPILIAGSAQIVLLTLFQGEMSLTYYAIVFGLFGLFWNIGIPYQVGVLVSRDRDMRFVALIPAFQGTGLALGPALAGAFIGIGSYIAVNIIAGIALLLYMGVILPFARVKS